MRIVVILWVAFVMFALGLGLKKHAEPEKEECVFSEIRHDGKKVERIFSEETFTSERDVTRFLEKMPLDTIVYGITAHKKGSATFTTTYTVFYSKPVKEEK